MTAVYSIRYSRTYFNYPNLKINQNPKTMRNFLFENRVFGSLLIMLLILLLVGLFSSCESRESRLNSVHPEFKAVVLSMVEKKAAVENDYMTASTIIYRLKDLSTNTVMNRTMMGSSYYEVGDTILIRK